MTLNTPGVVSFCPFCSSLGATPTPTPTSSTPTWERGPVLAANPQVQLYENAVGINVMLYRGFMAVGLLVQGDRNMTVPNARPLPLLSLSTEFASAFLTTGVNFSLLGGEELRAQKTTVACLDGS
jgi:hypothetical protein